MGMLTKVPDNYLTINYTAFGGNNIAKLFDYQILDNKFVLKLKLCKNLGAIRFFQAPCGQHSHLNMTCNQMNSSNSCHYAGIVNLTVH